MKLFLDLIKSGIVCFVLVSGLAGYALSMTPFEAWDVSHLAVTMLSLFFFSAGSFAINQAQEWQIDSRMPRTTTRPIPSGKITPTQAWIIGLGFVVLGILLGLLISPLVAAVGLVTVVLYNLLYTMYWKKKWAFGAVPGAIPGALPVVFGYAANTNHIFQPDIIYAFLILFLWQMPHFWSIAIRYKDDYKAGGIPVLPTVVGTNVTLFHMALYMFAYVGLALASPWFTSAYFFYICFVVPFALKVLYEFFRYYNTGAQQRWLPFFLWTNFSMLVFLIAPVIDKWHRFYLGHV